MEKRFAEIEVLLAGDIPLELLAKDSATVTPGQLQEMRAKAIETVRDQELSVNLQLFLGYLLYHGEGSEPVVEELLARTLQTAEGAQEQETHILMGRLQEQKENNAAAVEHYLAAVRAGAAPEHVAHYLAKVYRVDIETILPSQPGTQGQSKDIESDNPGIPAVPLSASSRTAARPEADETEFTFPKPRAVLIPSP